MAVSSADGAGIPSRRNGKRFRVVSVGSAADCVRFMEGGAVNKYLTTKQAAERLGVTPGRVRQIVSAGDLRAEKIGRDIVIAEREIRRYKRPRRGRPKGK